MENNKNDMVRIKCITTLQANSRRGSVMTYIPKKLREHLGVQKGDCLEMEAIDNDSFIVRVVR